MHYIKEYQIPHVLFITKTGKLPPFTHDTSVIQVLQYEV